MILGVGVDVTPISRMAAALSRNPERLAARLFTDQERAYCETRPLAAQHFAARFAAKEALLKALKAPPGLAWREIEVVRDADGAPSLKLNGEAAKAASAAGVVRLHLSLSHAGDTALAYVVAEGG